MTILDNEISPDLKIFVEDIDVTSKFVIDHGTQIEWISDYPNLTSFTASSLTFYLNSITDEFDISNPNNFFVAEGLPAHGRKAKVIVQFGLSAADLLVIFAGLIEEIETQLTDTKTKILVLDLSSQYRRDSITNFGIAQTSVEISDFRDANADYSKSNPIFRFPESRFPISRNSVSITTPAGVSIVPSVESEGELSYRNVEVDHPNGTLLFESEPPNAELQQIIADWKHPLRYRRPDTLARLLLEHAGFFDELGITDTRIARASIKSAKLRDTEPRFSSHGRPRWGESTGIVRYMMRDGVHQNIAHLIGRSPVWFLVENGNFIEYDEYQDEISIISSVPDSDFALFQFTTADFDRFFFLATNRARGDVTNASDSIRIYQYIISAGTWTLLADESDEYPQLAHPYDLGPSIYPVADNRKSFHAVRISSTRTDLYYIYADSASEPPEGGIKRYSTNTNAHTIIYSYTSGPASYGVDFKIDGSDLYAFVVEDDSTYGVTGAFQIWKMEISGDNPTMIYNESFSGQLTPATASDIILDSDNDRWYFSLDFHGSSARGGESELSRVDKSGMSNGDRVIIRRWDIPQRGARSPASLPKLNTTDNLRIFYLEGSSIYPLPTGSYTTDETAGNLLEINLSDESIIDHGVVWRSAKSLDPTDLDYDGYGVHSTIPSNMINDGRDNLHFISGFGQIIDFVVDPDPFADTTDPIPRESNFIWTQWGRDLSTKIPFFPTNEENTWGLLEQLATSMNWEVGFGVDHDFIDELKSNYPDSDLGFDFGLNANLFFRPRPSNCGLLASDLVSGTTYDTILLQAVGYRLDITDDFPAPARGKNYIIINDEVFSYTGISGNELQGVVRAELDSRAADHNAGDKIYYINALAINRNEISTLASVDRITHDFPNIYNFVEVPFADKITVAEDSQSIDEHGLFKFPVTIPPLTAHDQRWAQLLADAYLAELAQVRQLIEFTIKFSPRVQLGQLILLHETERIRIQHKKLRIVKITHNTRDWQTGILGREIL